MHIQKMKIIMFFINNFYLKINYYNNNNADFCKDFNRKNNYS